MAISTRDLQKVQDVPEVQAAIEARDAAFAAYREAAKAKMDADRLLDQRNDELEAVAARALESVETGGLMEPARMISPACRGRQDCDVCTGCSGGYDTYRCNCPCHSTTAKPLDGSPPRRRGARPKEG